MSPLFLDRVPLAVERRLSSTRGDGVRVVLRIHCDLDDRLAFVNRWLEVTTTAVTVVSDVTTDPVIAIPLSDIEGVRFEAAVGGACLTIARRACPPFRLSCSNNVTQRLSEAAKAIQCLSNGQPVTLPSRGQISRCPQCGRLLPEVGSSCPSCVKTFVVLRRLLAYLRPRWPIATALLAA